MAEIYRNDIRVAISALRQQIRQFQEMTDADEIGSLSNTMIDLFSSAIQRLENIEKSQAKQIRIK